MSSWKEEKQRREQQRLLRDDQWMANLIDQAITKTGKFAHVRGEKVTELQFYEGATGARITKAKYAEANELLGRLRKHGTRTMAEWYSIYDQRLLQLRRESERPKHQTKVPKREEAAEADFIGSTGFKGRNKNRGLFVQKFGHEPMPMMLDSSGPKNHFPLKTQQKRFSLKKVSSPGTWLLDLMFTRDAAVSLCYLVAICVNSRYLIVVPTNADFDENEEGLLHVKDSKKTKDAIVVALQGMVNRGWEPKCVQSDGEGAFAAEMTQRYIWGPQGVKFEQVRRMRIGAYPAFMEYEQSKTKSDPVHGSLALIDRVTRTIRDMAFNLKVGLITPDVMAHIVGNYNRAPHNGLSKMVGFEVSPKLVHEDPALEEYLIRRVLQHNDAVKRESGFDLQMGTPVRVYNEKSTLGKRRMMVQPGEWVVVRFKDGLYQVRNKNNFRETQWVPRWKLMPA